MPVQVQGPDGRRYAFPDGTDQAAAIAYFKKKGIGVKPAEQPSQPEQPGAVGRFLSSAGSAIASVPKGIYHAAADAPRNPSEAKLADTMSGALTVKRMLIDPQVEQGREAMDPSKSAPERVGHGLAAVLPAVGPWAAQVGEQIGKQAGSGDYAGAAGTLAGNAALYAAPKALGKMREVGQEGKVNKLAFASGPDTAESIKKTLPNILKVASEPKTEAIPSNPVSYVITRHDPLDGPVIDYEATQAKLPPVPRGYTRLFRSESPSNKFADVFKSENLGKFNEGRQQGKAFTDSLKYADYYRKSYGKDAKTSYVDVPNEVARKTKHSEGEYVLGDKDLETSSPARPSKTIGDYLGNIDKAKGDLNTEYANALGPYANHPTMPTAISQRILALETPNMAKTLAGRQQIAIIRRAAAEFQKPWTLAELDAERMEANSRLGPYEKQGLADQYSTLKKSRSVAIDKAIADGVRETVYPQMDQLAGKPPGYFASLKQQIGSLLDLQSKVAKQTKELTDKTARIKGAPALSKASAAEGAGSAASGYKHGVVRTLIRAAVPEDPLHTANKRVAKALRPARDPRYDLPRAAVAGEQHDQLDIGTDEGNYDPPPR